MIAPTIERDVSAIVQEAIEKHGAKRDALIPILSEVNNVLGYIPAEAFQEVRKQLQNDETTPDKKWTLITTSCLGLCSVGPVVLIDDDLYGNVSPDQIEDILAR